MPGLGSLIVRDIAEIVRDAADAAVAWPNVMTCLERAIGFDSGFLATTPGPARASQGAILGHDEAGLRSSIGACLAQLAPREVAQYLNRSRRDSDVWTTQRREEFAWRYPALSPRWARHMLVRVSLTGPQMLGINLERGACCSPFQDRELLLVDAIAPLTELIGRLDHTSLREPDLTGMWGLTRREQDMARLVVRGLQNLEVAQVLGLSVHTVRNTLVRVFEKARATTRAELVFLAHQGQVFVDPSGGALASADDGVLGFARLVKRLADAKVPARAGARDTAHAPAIYSPPA